MQQPQAGNMKGKRRNLKSLHCISSPIRDDDDDNKSNDRVLSPMSLLERFREAVFRLFMLSAVSNKPTTHHSKPVVSSEHRGYYPHTHDPFQSEAVADCIEFIKKSATGEESRP
uniref:Uncharacterized protein n=1 Tax=Nelumbo nucifera TaxID=4432 RepID=A0A822XQR1_NELNU|nr:TPA_asm: hypothetical protein HUJ06_023835 [Nelumbo nucifera]